MHYCPYCGEACHCNGDIDDITFGFDSEEALHCIHHLECEDTSDDGFFADDAPIVYDYL